MIPDSPSGKTGLGVRRHILPALILVALSVGVYAATLDDGFVNLDDDRFITRNPRLRSLSPRSVLDLLSGPHFGAYHPLHLLSYAIEYRLAGGWSPALLHADNVALHALNVLLVYLLMVALVPRRDTAFLGALLFALHPTHVENVAWLSQRKDLLSLLFVLLSFLLHVRSRKVEGSAWLPRLSWLCFILALLSKASAAPFPILIVTYDILLGEIPWRKALRRSIPFFAAAALAGFGMWVFQREIEAPVGAFGHGPAAGKALIALAPAYARLFILPARLALFYPPPGVGASVPGLLLTLIPILLLVFVLRRRPLAIFCLIWAGVTLLPTLSLIPYGHFLADRYLYVPSVTLCLLLALPIARGDGGTRRTLLLAALSGIALLFGAGTFQRSLDWGDPVRLWEAQLRGVPRSIIARNNLASLLEREGKWQRVLDLHMEVRAICEQLGARSHRYYAGATWRAGRSLVRLGRLDEASAALTEARGLRPEWVPPILEMARLEQALGRPSEAKALIDEARAMAAGDLPGSRDRLRIARTQAELFLQAGDPGRAVPVLEAARREDATDPDVPLLLGKAYLLSGNPERAEAALRAAVAEDPRNLRAIDRVLASWIKEGRPEAPALVEIQRRITGGAATDH